MTRAPHLVVALAAALAAAGVRSTCLAQVAPLPSGLFAFPSSNPSPASATSAALGLADRWLGDDPFDNAAAALQTSVAVSPMLLRVNRQDLRAVNSEYVETSAFVDLGGARAGYAPKHGNWGVAAYVSHPVLRREESAFTHGDVGGPVPPVMISSTTETRELRGGIAIALRRQRFAIGVAPEWTMRSDRLTAEQQNAGPASGQMVWDLSGSSVGFQAAACLALPPHALGGLRAGASVRYVPEIKFDDQGSSAGGQPMGLLDTSREAAWEGGVSVEAHLGPTFRVILGGGGRIATAWKGLDVANGRSAQFAIAGEYHDPEVPWVVRFGGGRESNPGTPESAAGVFGLGFGWVDGGLRYDAAVLHRGLDRSGSPTSADDRVIASVTFTPGGK